MARFLDGYTPKKKKKDEETQQKKAKSPSVSNNNYKRANQGSDYVSRKDGGQGSGLTRRTANKPTVNRQPSYVNRSNNQPMSRKDGGDGFQTSRRTQTQPQTSARTRTTPATSREWMSRKDGGEGTPRRTATERASDLGSRFAQQARTNRAGKVQDSQWASRKEGGEGSYRPKTAEEMQRNRKRGFIDDAASVVGSTLKQTAAAESRFLWEASEGELEKSYMRNVPEEAKERMRRENRRMEQKFGAKIDTESAKMEKLKEGHSYLGRMGLDAVSSTTGMATDMAWGPLSLAHMFARSYGTTRGQVNKKTERLRQQMLDSGNYSPQEVDEMFADMDQRDRFNAMASAGIEVLSEKLFPGIGIGRKVIGGKGASIAEKVMGRLATKAVNRSGVLGNVARGTLEEIAEEEVGGPLQAKAANVIYGNRLQAISDDNTRRALQNQSDDLRSQIKTPEDAQAVAARLNSDEFYNESKQTYLDAGCTEKEADTLANLSRDYLTASLTGDTETMQKCQDKMVDILSEDQKEHFGLQDAIDSAVSTAMMTAATGAPGAITSTQIGNEYKKNAGMDAVRNLADIAVKYDPDNSIKAQTIRDMIDKGEDISGTQVHELIQIASDAATASFEREDAKDTTAERRMRHEGYLISPAVRAEDGSVILEEKTAERYDDIEAGYMEKAAGLSVPAEAADMAVNIATSYDLGVITAEQMNELSDKDVKEAFSDLTGINLNQYNVYDRKGNILVAESNIRMQNALFAKASDNLVESARLEQLNFDDKARGELIESVTRNTASNGAGAVAVAIQTVDTKDKSKMMLMGAAANRVYEMGMYTNQSWDDVRGAVARQFPGLDSDVLGLVFESGKADKAVQETEFYGRSVRAGEGMTRDSISDQALVPGEVVNTTGRVIGADEMGFLKDTADNFGIKVVIEDVAPEEVKKENGKTVKRIKEGKYDSKSNTLYVNVNEDVRKPLRAIVTHELTHSTIFAPDEMLELIEYIGDAWYRADPEGYKAAIEARREIYKAQDLSDLELLEEIVADGSIDYDFWNDPTLLDDIATKNQTLAEKFLSAIREILRKLRSVLANEPAEPQNEKQYTAMYAQVVDMAEAERLMMNALKAANKARADKAVSDWQDAVYAKDDTRDSISNAETDNEEIAQQIVKDVVNAPRYLRAFGIRKDYRQLAVGDYFDNSQNMVDDLIDEETGEYPELDGTSALGLPGIYRLDADTEDIVGVLEASNKYDAPYLYLVGGLDSQYGDDEGEVIINSAEVVSVLRSPANSQDIRYSQSLSAEQQETILHDVGPDIRFTIGTFRDEQAKGKFIASLNSGKGGFAGLSQIASGKDILRRVMEAKSFAPEQIKAATGFLEHMAGYLESDAVQMKYGFIGWDDLTDAKVSVRKDADGKIVSVAVSAMVVNGEYPVNFDMTTICNKREGVMEIIQALTKKYDADTGKTILNSIKLTDEKMWSINKALKAEGIDTACLGCFVEARRYYTNKFIDKIDDVWNSAVREARKKLGLPEEEYFNFAKGKKVSGEDYNQISDLWTAYDESSESKRSPAQRIKILMDEIVKNKEVDSPYLKLISAEDILTPEGIRGFKELSTHNKDRDMVKMIKSIYGTSAPKEILAFTPYNSEIALLPDKIKGTPTDEYLRSIGGTRVQSFSDFKMEHFFDHLQMVADEAARGFVNHGYSKVIAYPRLFGLTGRKINMSVMFDVLPASEWQKTLGCDEDTATRVARKYQGLRFVTEKPKENVDNRPYKEVTIEGVHGYLTYLVSDADYVNSVFDRLYQENIDAGMSEVEARRKANTDKPFEQSINYREAVELENKDGYKENVGIIGVAFGDEHLKMLLDDPNVRYIIPYHRSGLPVFIAQKTALDIARNYTDFQNTNKAKGGYWITPDGKNERMKSKYEKFVSDNSDLEYPAITFFDKEINGKGYTVEFGKKNNKEKGALAGTADFDVYENLESVKDIREIANAYLEYCIQHNYVPVFHEFAGHPNYYKMLFDFAVTDGTTTNIYPQKPVKNIYPGLNLDEIVKSGRSIDDLTEDDFKDFYAEINRGLAEQNAKTELRRNNLGKVLDQDLLSKNGENSIISDTNIQHIVNGTPDYTSVRYSNEEVTPEPTAADIRYSMSTTDSEGNILTDGQMEFFKNSQARDEDGRLIPMYHFTRSGGFTIFNPGYAFDNVSISFSNDMDFASNYAGDEDDQIDAYDNRFGDEELPHIEPGDFENENIGYYECYLNMTNPMVVNGEDMDSMEPYEVSVQAKAEDYDGVIIRNFQYMDADIYMVFSSNQVKDTRNENPTENPDIRFSMSLAEELKDHAAQAAEKITDIPLADPKLEDNRIRHSISAEDFESSIVSSWGKRTKDLSFETKETPLKNKLINVMKQVRKYSGTERQYKSETLDQTIKSVKEMYKYAKADNASEFAKAAWNAAERIVDDIDYNDDLYIKYTGIRDYFAKTNLVAPDWLVYDTGFHEFVRENQGRMRFFTDGKPIQNAYADLSKKFPDLFPSELTDPIDMLVQMDEVLTYIEPYKDAYTSEQHAALVDSIANNLCDIATNGEEYRSTIDDLKVKAMKQRHQEAIEQAKAQTEKQKQRADMWKQKLHERIAKDAQDRKEKAEKKDHRKKFEHILEDYNKLCKWVLDPTKEKNVPEEFRKPLAEFLQTLDLQTENSKALEEKTGHVANKTLNMRLIKDRLKNLAEMKSKDPEDNGNGASEFQLDGNVEFILEKLADKLDKNGNSIDALNNDDIASIEVFMKLLIRNIERYKEVKLETKKGELAEVGGRAVEFFVAKRDRDGRFKKKGGALGALDTINTTALTPAYLFDRMGPLKEMYDVLRHNGFDTYIRNEAVIIDKLSDILGKYYNTKKKKGKQTIAPGSEIEKWRTDAMAQTIELSDGKPITMTVAQIMSLYCLYQRGTQATDHMFVGGIVVDPIETSSKKEALKQRWKGKEEASEKRVLTPTDLENIIAKLTPEQMDVADKLQRLMSVDMAELGNEAHRELYGYNMFTEDNYFPIKVYGNERATEINNIGEVIEKIKSFGFTKPLTPNAGQAIEVGDIFSIVADHCNGMNLYNAYLVPITDFMRVLNYTHTLENGEVLTMKEAIEQAYGKEVLKYILNLMKDINGIKAESRGGIEGLMNKALGTAKRTAVFGNLRVALQQPTAIVRAMTELDLKYIKGVNIASSAAGFIPTVTTEAMREMFKYCPIAQWKSWGYYDTYMGRDIEDVMMNNWSVGDKLLSGYYGQLDNATWAIIWQAVKAEQHDKHPEMDVESEEFLQMCGRRASEVFDKTQVVDSTFHRSDAMRNKEVAVKLFTAFMAEPTLTLNVLRAGLYHFTEEMKAGNKSAAFKILSKTITAIVLQAAMVSAAQAFADAWRGKDPGMPGDDDDDETKAGYWTRWVHNYINNMIDQLHFENNMYLVKDITPYANFIMSKIADHYDWNPVFRAVLGWDQEYLYDQNNLIFAGLDNIANGVAMIFKKIEKGDDYSKDWYDILQKTLGGIGTFTGIPVGTLMRDFHPIWNWLFMQVSAADTLGVSKLKKSDKSESSSASETYDTEDLPDDLTDEQKDEIRKAGEKRKKKNSKKEEVADRDKNKMLYDAEKSAAGYEGAERDKRIWQSVSQGYKDHIANGDYAYIAQMRSVVEQAGGDLDYFDQRIMEASKSALKKTIEPGGADTESEMVAQQNIKMYLLRNGMSAEDLSSEIVYKSAGAKDLKVAFRINDNYEIQATATSLIWAGLTADDYNRLYENRNRIDLKKYNGKYKDRLKSTGKYIWPASGPITSPYGYRNSPTRGASSFHQAIDIGAAYGSPVVAADGGTVIFAGWNGGGGKTVKIQHDDGSVTFYQHLSWWDAKVGDTVSQGQEIGKVGSTGVSTGPHLDFRVQVNGELVDPMKYLDILN